MWFPLHNQSGYLSHTVKTVGSITYLIHDCKMLIILDFNVEMLKYITIQILCIYMYTVSAVQVVRFHKKPPVRVVEGVTRR